MSGGATGGMLAAILKRYSGPRGTLYDRPHVVAEALKLLAAGVSQRIAVETGDFFETVPAGGDSHVLSHIPHDWQNDPCPKILGPVREAIDPRGRLLIVEMVVPAGDGADQDRICVPSRRSGL